MLGSAVQVRPTLPPCPPFSALVPWDRGANASLPPGSEGGGVMAPGVPDGTAGGMDRTRPSSTSGASSPLPACRPSGRRPPPPSGRRRPSPLYRRADRGRRPASHLPTASEGRITSPKGRRLERHRGRDEGCGRLLATAERRGRGGGERNGRMGGGSGRCLAATAGSLRAIRADGGRRVACGVSDGAGCPETGGAMPERARTATDRPGPRGRAPRAPSPSAALT